MKFQKLLFPLFAIITITAAVAISIFLLNTEDKAPKASEVTTRSLLFVYEGENAELEPIGGSGTEFTLSVPIASKESKVTWFTDRPNRDAGHMSYENFVKLYYSNAKDSFKIDPPNVAIQLGSTTLIAEMTEPKIITGTNNAESIIATFTLVSGSAKDEMVSEKSFIASHVSRSGQVKSIGGARTIERVSIFVDDMFQTTLKNITSKPITNTYEVMEPYGPEYNKSLWLYGDFPFDLPKGLFIAPGFQEGCQDIMINGEDTFNDSMLWIEGSGNMMENVGVYYQPADPNFYQPPASYTSVTWTLFCEELEVTSGP